MCDILMTVKKESFLKSHAICISNNLKVAYLNKEQSNKSFT